MEKSPPGITPRTNSAPATRAKCILEPIDLHDQAQADELLRQRVLCGWAMSPDCIPAWRDAMATKTKSFFWIKPESQPDLRVGHISLDSEAEPPDLELANPHDKSVLTIARFFVLLEHRGTGIGRAAMEMLESRAQCEPYGSPNCKAVAISTLSRKYWEDDEYRNEFKWLTGSDPRPRGTSNEDWYARMGYVKWKEVPTYECLRPDRKLLAVYMKKIIA